MNEILLRRVEDAGLNASAPQQQLWVDGWIVRLSPGKAKRARCVNAVALGMRPLDVKLQECAELFRAAGLPLVMRLTPFSQPPALDLLLEQRGWASLDDTRVMVLDDLGRLVAPPTPAGIEAVTVEPERYAQAIGRLRGSTWAQIEAHAQRLAGSPVPFRGLIWQRAGEVVACGQVAREGALAGLYDVFTAPVARGLGLARALCATLLVQARAEGAQAAYLQVDAGNLPAHAVYRHLGFVDGYRYHYRSPEAGAH